MTEVTEHYVENGTEGSVENETEGSLLRRYDVWPSDQQDSGDKAMQVLDSQLKFAGGFFKHLERTTKCNTERRRSTKFP